MKRHARVAAALALVLLLQSCELLNSGVGGQVFKALEPELTLGGVALVRYPSVEDLARYCPDYLGTTACTPAIGPRPTEDRLQFHFEIRYLIDNPNKDISIPTTEILAAIRVFEGKQSAELGAVCAVLCNEGDLACTGAPGANSCKSDAADITSWEDVAQAVVTNLLVIAVDLATGGSPENIAVRMIPPGAENFEVVVRFSLGLHAMLDIMSSLFEQVVNDFVAGKDIKFEIPIVVHGTLWFDLSPWLGRIALPYGPFNDVWTLVP